MSQKRPRTIKIWRKITKKSWGKRTSKLNSWRMTSIRQTSKKKKSRMISNNRYKTRNPKLRNLRKSIILNFKNRIPNFLSLRNNWVRSKTRLSSCKSICRQTCRLIRKLCSLKWKSRRIRMTSNSSRKTTILREWNSLKLIWISNCRPPKNSSKIVKRWRTTKNEKSMTSSNITKNCRRTSKESRELLTGSKL